MRGDDDDSPILPWRVVAGILIHVAPLAYVATLVLAWLTATPADRVPAAFLQRALPLSGWFLLLYTILSIAIILAVGLLDPPLRAVRRVRRARDPREPARVSARQLATALCQFDAIARNGQGDGLARTLVAIRAGGWVHDDERYQALSSDLAEAGEAFTAALASAAAARRPALVTMAAETIARIAAAQGELASERSRLDEGDARTIARYVDVRYGSNGESDLAGPA